MVIVFKFVIFNTSACQFVPVCTEDIPKKYQQSKVIFSGSSIMWRFFYFYRVNQCINLFADSFPLRINVDVRILYKYKFSTNCLVLLT